MAKRKATTIEQNDIDQKRSKNELLDETEKLNNELKILQSLRCLSHTSVTTTLSNIEKIVKELIKLDNKNQITIVSELLITCLLKLPDLPSYTNSSILLFSKLFSCIEILNIKSLPINELCKYFKIIIEHIAEKNRKIEQNLVNFAIEIGQVVSSAGSLSKITESIVNIMNENKLSHISLFNILFMMNSLKLNNELALMIISQILSHEINKENQIHKYPYEFLEKLFPELLKSCQIYDLEKYNEIIYKYVMEICLSKHNAIQNDMNRIVSEKSEYVRLEKVATKTITSHLENTKLSGSSQSFLRAFKTVLKTNINKNGILNNFLICIYLNVQGAMKNNSVFEQLNEAFAENVKNSIAVNMEIKKSNWLQCCTAKNSNIFQLNHIFKVRLLLRAIPINYLITGFLNITKNLLDKICQAIETDKLVTDYVQSFVYHLLKESFLYCTSEYKETLMSNYLTFCFQSPHKTYYIAKLELIFENEIIRNMYCTNIIRHSIISKITGSNDSILMIDLEDGISLINSLKYFLNDSRLDGITKLIEYFSLNIKNFPSEKKSVFCLVNLLKVLNSKSEEQTHKDEDRVEINVQFSLRILEIIKEILKKSKDASLKSYIYYMFNYIIRSNAKLTNPIQSILLKQIKKYIINSADKKDIYFNLSNCLIINDNDDRAELIEEIDVLFHCVCVCIDKTLPPFRNDLEEIVNKIRHTYVENSETNLINDIYDSQISDILAKQSDKLGFLKLIHQIKVGFVDSLMENCFMRELIGNWSILENYHKLLIEKQSFEIEQSNSNLRTNNTKRKLFDDKTIAISNKKVKYNSENQTVSIRETRSTAKNRKPLKALVTNIVNAEKSTENDQSTNKNTKKKISFINFQIKEYEPRISLECCANLLALTQKTNHSFNDIKLTISTDSHLFISLITNTNFYEYVIKIIQKKLEFLLNINLVNNINNTLDMKFKESSEIFNSLKSIWKNSYNRINKAPNSKLEMHKTPLMKQLDTKMMIKNQRWFNICFTIWKIVEKNDSKLLIHLIADDDKVVHSVSSNKNILWNFLMDCTNQIDLIIKKNESYAPLNDKICCILLKMIFSVIDTYEISTYKLNDLHEWLTKIAKKNIAGENEMSVATLELLIKIQNQKYSSTGLIKNLLTDYRNFVNEPPNLPTEAYLQFQNDNYDHHNECDHIEEFTILNEKNSTEYYKFIMKQLQISIDQIKWAIDLNNYFDHSKLAYHVDYNLKCIISSLDSVIKSVANIKTVNLSLNILKKFYESMIYLSQSKFVNQINNSFIKIVTKNIYTQLHNDIEYKLNFINETLVDNEQNNCQRPENNQVKELLNYKSNLNELISIIEDFETKICKIYESFRNIDEIHSFKPYLSNFNLSSSSKLTKELSQNQINEIFFQ